MIGSWESARLKFRRAVEHLDALDEEVRRFVYHEIERLEAERDPESTEPIQAAWMAIGPGRVTQPPFLMAKMRHQLPPRFGVILGDYLGNLRSALDHAVNGVAGENAGLYTKFPISNKVKSFKNRTEEELAGVPDPCRAQIERMQPYHGHSRGQRLLLLAELSNVDKHKVMHASSFLTYQGVWTWPGGAQVARTSFVDYGVLGDKAKISIAFEGPYSEPKVEGGAPYQIAFSERPGSVALCTRLDLALLRDEVRGIIFEIEHGEGATLPPLPPHVSAP